MRMMAVMLHIVSNYIFKIGTSKKIVILMLSVLLISPITTFVYSANGYTPGASLVIDAPSQIYGGEVLQVIVNDSADYPIGDVLVTVSNDTLGVSDYTDMDGTVSFTSPLVEYTALYIINASKPGFESDQALITVLVNSLILYVPSEVIEGERFEARVTDIIDNPIENAIISCPIFPTYTFHTNRDGIALLTAPNVDEDTTYDLTARKDGYQSGVTKIRVNDNASLPEEQLVIIVTSSVVEGESFTITVTANGAPIENVEIEFNGETYYTRSDGTAAIMAPEVIQDTNYLITASKTDYLPNTIWIAVLNEEIIVAEGWIYGIVTNSTGSPLEDVSVCVMLFGSTTSRCTFTDKQGGYNILVPAGTHTVIANLNEYQVNIKSGIPVEDKTAFGVNFILEKIEESGPPLDVNEQLMQAAIRAAIEDDEMGGEISLLDSTQEIKIYRDDLNIEILELSNEEISFNVAGEEDTPAIFAVHMPTTALLDVTNINVTYDNISVELGSFDSIFNLQAEKPYYGVLITANDSGEPVLNIIISVPGFSEHTITISSFASIPAKLVQYTELVIVAAIAIIAIAAIFMFRKGKEEQF
jgi:hypothetical protein